MHGSRSQSADRPARPGLPLAARRHPLVAACADALAGDCDVPGGAMIVVGVSGGPDSLALLIALHAIARRTRDSAYRVTPVAAHVHHHLRPDADADAIHVRAVCDRLGVPLEVVDVHPRDIGGNIAAAARSLRYEALAGVAERVGSRWIAVAHHAEDQLETMLMHLCRGSGPAGLTGMAASRGLTERITLVRPLLDWRKVDCIDLCRAADLTWRDDPTNADPSTARGRLRADAIPTLEALWPGAATSAANAAFLMTGVRDLVDARVCETFGDDPARTSWPRDVLRPQPPIVLAAGLLRAVTPCLAEVDRTSINATMLRRAAAMIRDTVQRPRTLDWPGNSQIVITAREVRMIAPASTTDDDAAPR